jgi:dTDP-4-dehydrorhamnose 3,5-epimerase
VKVETTKIEGLLILHPNVFGDDRGWFMESFNQQRFEAALKELSLPIPTFVQDNHSLSQKGCYVVCIFNVNLAQGKLVRVVQGKVWDVAVDIRPESKTYGEWVGLELSAENKTMFWIPEGLPMDLSHWKIILNFCIKPRTIIIKKVKVRSLE